MIIYYKSATLGTEILAQHEIVDAILMCISFLNEIKVFRKNRMGNYYFYHSTFQNKFILNIISNSIISFSLEIQNNPKLVFVWALCRMLKADVRGLKTKMTEQTPSFIHKCIISNSCFFTLSFSAYYNTQIYT